MRVAAFLAVAAATYFFFMRDAVDIGNADLSKEVLSFVRSDSEVDSSEQNSKEQLMAVPSSGVDPPLIELHNAALASLKQKKYRSAYQQMQQLYQLEGTPSPKMAVNASRVAGHWARELQREYKTEDALQVWRKAVEWHHDAGHPQLALARLLLRMTEVEQALEVVVAGLSEFPEHVQLLMLRGEIASLMGDSQLAVTQFKAAAALQPDDLALAQRLTQLEIEARAFADYLSASTSHFESSFDSQNPSMVRNIDDLQQDLENAWLDVSGMLGIISDRRIVVLWLAAEDYQGQAPDWSAGIYDGRIRVVVDDYPERRPQLLATLKHELTHALLHSTGIKLPTFIQEGLAQLYEPRPVERIRESYLVDDDLPSLEQLQGNWTSWTDNNQVQVAYAYALSLCDFVVEHYGDNAFVILLDNMRHQDLLSAWQATFGVALSDSDKLHRQFLTE